MKERGFVVGGLVTGLTLGFFGQKLGGVSAGFFLDVRSFGSGGRPHQGFSSISLFYRRAAPSPLERDREGRACGPGSAMGSSFGG